MNHAQQRVVVVGGGISGLATAHRLVELAPNVEVTLFEAAPRLGGVLETVRHGDYLLESGADNFITNVPWAIDLCRRVGLEHDLLQTRPGHRTAFVVRRGRLHKIPQGFIIMAPSRMWPIMTTGILSPLGKLRLAAEYFVPPRKEDGDESLAEFVTRRLGREAYDRLVQPLIGGIYTGDPRQLSLLATMPRFREMERKHGSMTRAMLRQMARRSKSETQSSGGRYSMFVAPREGMASLVEALAQRLPARTICTNGRVERIERQPDGRWQVELNPGSGLRSAVADAIVLATPAGAAAHLLRPLQSELADELAEIHHSSCAIVTLVYRRDQIAHPMDGFGFVVPIVEKRKILSGSFASVKYVGRAPENEVVIRVFIGGTCQSELLDLDDAQLRQLAIQELAELMGIHGTPQFDRIVRYRDTMPQYYVGHQDRVQRIAAQVAKLGGLFVTGNAYQGVGVPFCIHGGEQTAEKVVDYLTSASEKVVP